MHQSMKEKVFFYCAATVIMPYKCGGCPNFDNHFLGNVKKHINEEHKLRIFNNPLHKCTKCNFVTYSRYLSLRHNLLNKCKRDDAKKNPAASKKENIFDCAATIIMPYKCGTCPNFDNHFLGNMKKHISEEHQLCVFNNPLYKCTNCNFLTNSRYLWLRHNLFNKCKLDDTNKDPAVEESDDHHKTITEKTLTFNTVSKHSRNPRNHQKNWFKCDYCDYETPEFSKVKIHISNEHSHEDEKVLSRDPCEYRCSKSGYATKHVATKHTPKDKKKWHHCEQCEYRTLQNCDLKKHNASKHTPDDEKVWYHCKCCEYKTIQRGHLKIHIAFKHTPEDENKWYHCDKCEFKTLQSGNLKKHIACKHTPEDMKKWLYCDQCEYRTLKRGHLKIHIAFKHTPDDEKVWYHCKCCEYKTIQRGQLKRHIAAKHTPEDMKKWLHCEQCEYRTLHSGDLKKHIAAKHTPKDMKKSSVKAHVNSKHFPKKKKKKF